MPDINIKIDPNENITHCNKCAALILSICTKGISGINSLELPCLYKADDLNKYLLQCIIECLNEKEGDYIKPKLISDGRWEYYNKTYLPNNYELIDLIISGDANMYLVNGEAGIGKSTFLKELYFETALYSLTDKYNIMPIMLRVDGFGNKDISPENWINQYLKGKYRYINFESAFFNPNLEIVFFLDAIDDIQYVDYIDFKNKLDAWNSSIEQFFCQYSNIKFVISSRYLDYLSSFQIRNFTRLFIQSFDDTQVSLFLNQKKMDLQDTQQLLEMIEQNKELPFLRNPFFLNKLISIPRDKIKNRTDIINVFLNSIFSKGNMFIQRNKIEIIINGVIFKDIKLDKTTFFSVLSQLAFNNQKQNKLEISIREIETIIPTQTEQFIELAKNNLILSKDSLKFTHPILQEYFAGRYIFMNLSSDYKFDDIMVLRDIKRLTQSLKHVYNLLMDKEKFIKLLIDNTVLKIAAECILEDKEPHLNKLVTEAIIQYLKQYSNNIQEASDLGYFLGKLGDTRITSGLSSSGVIEPRTVTVPGNKNLRVGIYPVTNLEYSYFINDNGYENKEYWEDNDSFNWFNFETRVNSICNFWYKIQDGLNSDKNKFIKFCLDNKFDKELIANLSFFKAIPKQEFEMMITDLYSDEKNMKPLMWDNPTYNNPSQPVVGISIYEAFAYCNWLSQKTQKKYRLLTNEEWENIVEANKKAYVYGNTFKTSITNTRELGLKKVLPVGICCENASKNGIFDLTGNIFEWTSSVYQDETDNIFKQYVCKGGSWIQDFTRAKSKYLGRGMGWVKNLDLGFRICYDEDK